MNHLTAKELALYLGCYVWDEANNCIAVLQEVRVPDEVAVIGKESGRRAILLTSEVKLILRRLTSMTEEEYRAVFEVNRILTIPLGFTPQETKTLLSLHFDLFGWIDSGKALDKATL